MVCIQAPPGGLYPALFENKTPGVIALVGAGGKTSAITALARELTGQGRSVVITTTTKMHPPEDSRALASSPAQAQALLKKTQLVWVGTYYDKNKMTGIPGVISQLRDMADYVLLEADGARRHPLKMADHTHEPVLPPETDAVVAAAGLDAIGTPLAQVVHRTTMACEALGTDPAHIITPADVAALLHLSYDPRYVILNKADTPERIALANQVAQHLPHARCVVTSFQSWGLAEGR